MKSIVSVALIVVLAVVAQTAFAQEPEIPAQPDPTDNLCFEGGAWDDGRCNIPGHEGASDLAWQCGYYMARVLDGRLNADDVPAQCQHLIPKAVPLPADSPIEGRCILFITSLGCIYANQIGTIDDGNDGGIDRLALFTDNPERAACAPTTTYNGATYFLDDAYPIRQFFPVFTPPDFESLGILPYFCGYLSAPPQV